MNYNLKEENYFKNMDIIELICYFMIGLLFQVDKCLWNHGAIT